jgi:hypothetical protein
MRISCFRFAPAAAALLLALTAWPASAKILIEVDKAAQRMTVSQDGSTLYTWPVSTGTQRYDTPDGSFTPFRMEKEHYSREWDDAPMPHSIFFTKRGHAIHGTSHASIGRPASHGCVRLSLANARVLFDLVKREGMANTSVVLSGTLPASVEAPAVARRAPRLKDRPRYVEQYNDNDDGEFTEPVRRPYVAQREYRPYAQRGYWVRYPDGSRVYRDRDDEYRRMAPSPFFIDRRYGWD